MAKSAWINKDVFNKFKTRVQEDAEKKSSTGSNFNSDLKWDTPEKGTAEKPLSYSIRLLPDKSSNFYKKLFYHMFKVGDKWSFSICPKTFDMEAYCPICSVTTKLYKSGSETDKQEAYQYKRKEKFVTNIYVVNDPRDQDRDDDKKSVGKVKLWEFPSKVEQIIRSSINDSENGVGMGSYDPSENGYNFILKVGATKPQADGKVWPDYSTSTFARSSSSIADSDDEIDSIIEQTTDIEDYLRKQLPKEENVIKDLKAQLVFDLIEDEYNKMRNVSTKTASKVKEESSNDNYEDEKVHENGAKEEKAETSTKTTSRKSSFNDDDAELLAELENL